MVAECRPLASDARQLPPGHEARRFGFEESRALAELYFAAYLPANLCDSLDSAIEEIALTFAGGYGPVWSPGNMGTWVDGTLTGAVMAVLAPDWASPFTGPFIIELFTAPTHRKLGIGRHLLERCLSAAHDEQHTHVALKVDFDNAIAQSLYLSTGFMFI